MFASAFHPSLGGVEEVVRQLAHAQQKKGEAPIVVTNRWPRELPFEDCYEEIPIFRPIMRSPGDEWRRNLMFRLTNGATQKQCSALMKSHAVDVVHIHCVSAQTRYAMNAAREMKLPLVVTMHGELTMDAQGIFQYPQERALYADALHAADCVTACSQQTLDEGDALHRETYKAPLGRRGRAIHNGIDPQEFANPTPFAHPRPYLLAIGRHVAQKGFDVLLRAFALLEKELGEATPDLILAGDGAEHEALKKLAGELNLQARVIFTGRVDRAKTVSLFAGCEFFVLSSRLEPFGIVNLEAMACGKAILATRVGGVPEFVSEREGILVPPDDAQALCQGMKTLHSSPDLAVRLGASGKERVRDFTWDAVSGKYRDCYTEAVAHAALKV